MLSLKKILNNKKNNGVIQFFSLEERLFNTVCFISFFTALFELFFNIYVGNTFGVCLSLFGVFFCVAMYYLSYYKRKAGLAIRLLCFVSHIAFGVNYFYSSGIDGPSYMFFALNFLMIVAIIPKEEFKIWVPLNLLLFFTVMIVEFFYPQYVLNIYNQVPLKLLNFSVTYVVLVVVIYFAINFIRKNYEIERFLVVEKNKAIEHQKLELERLNSEKDKLFSIVSHDLRHPLSSIQGYLELLEDGDLTDEEQVDLKRQLLIITKNTSTMLSNVLSWAKSQMEGSYAVLELLSVKDVLAENLNVEMNIAIKKGIKLTIMAEDGLKIMADKNMFQIVIRNLVSNAIKFTPANGCVTVYAKKKNDLCCITVEDTGLGIDLAQQKKLFKLKASSTYGTNNEKGIGLGLLLCKEFTDLQGGNISFKSSKSSGSTFFVSFKLAS